MKAKMIFVLFCFNLGIVFGNSSDYYKPVAENDIDLVKVILNSKEKLPGDILTYADSLSMVKLLVENGAYVNVARDGLSAFQRSLIGVKKEIVEYLLPKVDKYYENTIYDDKGGESKDSVAIDVLITKNQFSQKVNDMLKLLVSNGFKATEDSLTNLARNNNFESFKYIIENNAFSMRLYYDGGYVEDHLIENIIGIKYDFKFAKYLMDSKKIGIPKPDPDSRWFKELPKERKDYLNAAYRKQTLDDYAKKAEENEREERLEAAKIETKANLENAIKNKDVELVKSIVNDNISLIDKSDNNYMQLAFEQDSPEIVIFLFDNNFQFPESREFYQVIFIMAARQNRLEVVKKFISQENINSTFNKKTALEYAAENDYINIVEYLISVGAVFDIKTYKKQNESTKYLKKIKTDQDNEKARQGAKKFFGF